MTFTPNGQYQQPPASNGQANYQAPGPVQYPNAGPSPGVVGQPAGPGFDPQQQWQPQPQQFAPQQYMPPTSQPSPVVPPQQWQGQPAGAMPDPQQQWPQPQPPAAAPPAQPAPQQFDQAAIAAQLAQQQAYAQHYAQQQQQPQYAPQQQQQQPPQEPEWTVDSYFDQQWAAPTWSPTYDQAIAQGIVVKDPNSGLYAPAPGMEPMAMGILPAMNAHEQHRAAQIGELFGDNPLKAIYHKFEEPIERLVEQRAAQVVQEELDRRDQDSFLSKYEQDNSAWMYQNVNGQRVATPAGMALKQHVETLYKQGVDLKTAVEYAEVRVKPQSSPQQPAAPYGGGVQTLPPDPLFAQQQQQLPPYQQQSPQPQTPGYPQQQVPQPNQPLVPPPAAQPAPQQQSFLEAAAQRSGYQAGMSPGSQSAPPAGGIQMTEAELDSIFTNAAARAGIT